MPEVVENKPTATPKVKIEQPTNPRIYSVTRSEDATATLTEQYRTKGKNPGGVFFRTAFPNEIDALLFVGVSPELATILRENRSRVPQKDPDSPIATVAKKLVESASVEYYKDNLDEETNVFDEKGFVEGMTEFEADAPTMSGINDKIEELQMAIKEEFDKPSPSNEVVFNLGMQMAGLKKKYDKIKAKRKNRTEENGE